MAGSDPKRTLLCHLLVQPNSKAIEIDRQDVRLPIAVYVHDRLECTAIDVGRDDLPGGESAIAISERGIEEVGRGGGVEPRSQHVGDAVTIEVANRIGTIDQPE